MTTDGLPVNDLRSPTIGALAAALAVAQSQIQDALKDSENPYFGSTYADLASVWRACREPLSKNGLAVIQTTELGPGGLLLLRTTLAHSSGEWTAGLYPIRPMRQIKQEGWTPSEDPQSLGSAMRYARRYTLEAVGGVAPAGDDDDGNAATGRTLVPQRADGSALVVNIEEKTGIGKSGKDGKPGKPWTRYLVTFDDGRSGSTFDKKLADQARQAAEAGSLMVPTLEQSGQYTNLTALAPPRIDPTTGEVLPDEGDTPITEHDRKLLIAAAAQHGLARENGAPLRALLAEFGYSSDDPQANITGTITRRDFPAILQRVKGGVP